MISVTILVKNGASTLEATLNALKDFDEVVVIDTGSTDSTIDIAKKYSNVRLYKKKFIGFGPNHNEASALAKNDWILSIDADEVVTLALCKEIFDLAPAMARCPSTVYFLNRHNYFNGKQIKWCGWGSEKCARLYNRTKTAFSEALVHEGVITKGLPTCTLKSPLIHHPYQSISDFLKKMELYSTLFAEQHKGKKKSSPFIAFYHGVGAFLRSFLVKRGFLGGYEGFLISLYNGHTAFYKYLKLYHLNANLPSKS
jgi:glycosyltransferase involved in cell wall biosynthesis